MIQSLRPVSRVLRHRRGFSLTELLVAIGLIVVLLSLVLVALRAVRGQSDRSALGASLRQMSQAFATYHADNNGALLPGYLSQTASQDRVGARVRDAGGRDISGTEDAAPYLWRLSEYLDDWTIALAGYSTGLKDEFVREVGEGIMGGGSAGDSALGAARAPAICMNTIRVGGDDRHFITGTPGEFGNRDPWSNRFETPAVTSVGQVRNTARLVVFAPATRWDAATWGPAANIPSARNERIGSPVLVPPRLPNAAGALQDDTTWAAGATTASAVNDSAAGSWEADAGLPVLRGRAGEELVPIGRFDGSFASATLTELQADERFWNATANPTRVGESQ